MNINYVILCAGGVRQFLDSNLNTDKDEMEEVVDEVTKVTEEVEEDPDVVRDLLSTHSVWLRM